MSLDVPVRTPMGWQEYLQLDESTHGEYVGGALVMVPSPTQHHQRVCTRLFSVLHAAVPAGLDVSVGWGWIPPGAHQEFIPDVMVHPTTDEQARFTGVPELVVEVLSTNRQDDLTTKAIAYARGRAAHYWVVDPRDHVVLVYELVDDEYVPLVQASTGTLQAPCGGIEVHLDVDALLQR